MSLLQRIQEASTGVSQEQKFAQVGDMLIGEKKEPLFKSPPAPQVQEFEEPDDLGEPKNRFAGNQQAINFGKSFMHEHGFYPTDFSANHGISVSDAHLRSLARMKVASLNLKSRLKTEPIRMGASMIFKKVGRADIAEQLKGIDIDEGFEDFTELMEEVVFQELKDLQRTNNLRVPPAEELLKVRTWMMLEKMAGPGFSNVNILFDEGLKKIKLKK